LFEETFQKLVAARGRPLILGHRGSPQHARENTLASFWIALKEGADGIELDVHRTADGVLVAHHDEQLSTSETLASLTYRKLVELAREIHFEVPPVGDVFKVVAGRGFINIELKTTGFEAEVIQLARGILPKDSFAFSSFDPRAVYLCRQNADDVPALLITLGPRDGETDLEILAQLDASGIACEARFLTDELARLYRSHHYPLFAWTVNDIAEAKRLAAADVTGLISDVPAELVAALQPS
jgi:glycerophosphoryl diester phosphodiesterase